MARMHTKRKGKSKSRKPVLEAGAKIEGAEEDKEKIVKLILDYAKQGMPPALIGEKLKGVLPEKWRYNPQEAELLVKGH